jgi:hypothetical protein
MTVKKMRYYWSLLSLAVRTTEMSVMHAVQPITFTINNRML